MLVIGGPVWRVLQELDTSVPAPAVEIATEEHARYLRSHGVPTAVRDRSPPAGSLAAILCLEATAYEDPLEVLGKAYAALAEDGRLTIVEEMALERPGATYDGLCLAPHWEALAARCGYWVEQVLDLSHVAKEVLEARQAALCERYAELRRSAQVSSGILKGAKAHLSAQLDRLRRGESGFRLIHLRRRSAERWRVSHMEARYFEPLAQLFRKVFGQEMSRSLWEWKYGARRGQAVIAWHGEALVAHYGGITREILYFGAPEHACQIADVMVDSTERGVLTRRGPFFLTAASYPEVHTGYGARHLIGFGFPSRRHMKLAQTHGLYAEVAGIVELVWPASDAPLPSGCRTSALSGPDSPATARIVNGLWRRMRAELAEAIVGVRDPCWLDYRYFRHPQHAYRVLLLERGVLRRKVGILVLRRDGERCELVDVVAPQASIRLLLAVARREAVGLGCAEVYCWITEAYADRFVDPDAERRDPDIAVPTSVWTAGPPPERLRGRWWLMSGDTDFH